MLTAVRYQVQNFRNIDDSGPIPVERITAFVGRTKSGKKAFLKALHKFQSGNAGALEMIGHLQRSKASIPAVARGRQLSSE